jgi:hypothetical protein
VTRTITGNNYTATCADLIIAFGKALAILKNEDAYGSVEALEAENAAYDLAKECGWDPDGENFESWALKATNDEILVEALHRSLTAVRVQLDAFLARRKEPS